MPTAAKLVAALLFAALAWWVALLVAPRVPGVVPGGLYLPVCAGVGLVMGWLVMGPRAGEGLASAVGYGVTTALLTLFWCLLLWAVWRMFLHAARRRYEGPVEALEELMLLVVDYARLVWHGPTLLALFLGAALAGLATELSARRWP